jgi:hypothetical protein
MRALERPRSERGAVAVIVAIVVAVLLGFVAFVLNAGHATSVRGELQNASDAAALAAARELDGTQDGIDAARRVAVQFAVQHHTDTTRAVGIDGMDDVQFCSWDVPGGHLDWCLPRGTDPSAAQAAPSPPGMTQLEAVNAVRVLDGRETSRGDALPVWLSAFLGGRSTIDARSNAMAVGGGPCDRRCLIPLVFARCQITNPDSSLRCGQQMTFIFANDGSDNIGFTNLADAANVSNALVRSLLDEAIGGSGCIDVNVGDPIGIQNGNDLNTQLGERFNQLVGQIVYAPVVDFEGCPNPRYNRILDVAWFVSFTIDQVVWRSQDVAQCDGSHRCIKLTMRCDQQVNSRRAGCGRYGMQALNSQLVQ